MGGAALNVYQRARLGGQNIRYDEDNYGDDYDQHVRSDLLLQYYGQGKVTVGSRVILRTRYPSVVTLLHLRITWFVKGPTTKERQYYSFEY